MFNIQSEINGKKAYFGYVRKIFDSNGCSFCSNFEYDQGKFDAVLWQNDGETIYLRIPFNVLKGALDHPKAFIEFGTPYVIKHIRHFGLDHDENSFITTLVGLNQFREPADNDGYIMDKSRWEKAGQEKINQIMNSMNELLIS